MTALTSANSVVVAATPRPRSRDTVSGESRCAHQRSKSPCEVFLHLSLLPRILAAKQPEQSTSHPPRDVIREPPEAHPTSRPRRLAAPVRCLSAAGTGGCARRRRGDARKRGLHRRVCRCSRGRAPNLSRTAPDRPRSATRFRPRFRPVDHRVTRRQPIAAPCPRRRKPGHARRGGVAGDRSDVQCAPAAAP